MAVCITSVSICVDLWRTEFSVRQLPGNFLGNAESFLRWRGALPRAPAFAKASAWQAGLHARGFFNRWRRRAPPSTCRKTRFAHETHQIHESLSVLCPLGEPPRSRFFTEDDEGNQVVAPKDFGTLLSGCPFIESSFPSFPSVNVSQ